MNLLRWSNCRMNKAFTYKIVNEPKRLCEFPIFFDNFVRLFETNISFSERKEFYRTVLAICLNGGSLVLGVKKNSDVSHALLLSRTKTSAH